MRGMFGGSDKRVENRKGRGSVSEYVDDTW